MATTRNEHAEYTHWKDWEVKEIDGQLVRFSDVCVHEFRMGDVEDPDLYAAQPLWEWQDSEMGKWVMENAVEQPYWLRRNDVSTYGYQFKVMARLSEQNQTFWALKWAGIKK